MTVDVTQESLLELLWLDDISYIWEDDNEESWSISSLRDRIVESIDELDYLIRIDKQKSLLELYTREDELIWTIGKWTFERWKIFKKSHLFKRVEEKFRWKWYGTALIQEYIDAWFEVPEFEVTWIYETYILLIKFWYFFYSILNPQTWEEILTDFIPDEKQIKQLMQKWYVIKLNQNE